MSARPGGWVNGIGWVARLGDLTKGDVVLVEDDEAIVSGVGDKTDPDPITVVRWADGTVPAALNPDTDGGWMAVADQMERRYVDGGNTDDELFGWWKAAVHQASGVSPNHAATPAPVTPPTADNPCWYCHGNGHAGGNRSDPNECGWCTTKPCPEHAMYLDGLEAGLAHAQPSRCPYVVGHPDSTQHCALNGPDLTELAKARNRTLTCPSYGTVSDLCAAVDRLLATEGGK